MRTLTLLLPVLLLTPTQAARQLKLVTTAYCLGPCRICQTTGRTYLGSRSLVGAAVGRRKRAIPLGSRVSIPHYGKNIPVDDVGGGVRSNQLDLRMPHAQAKRWGRRTLVVTLHERVRVPQKKKKK